MGRYSELIKHFYKTRDYIRDFFINGFKTRQDFAEKKSARTYDDEKRRVESWLKEYIKYNNTKKGKTPYIFIDCSKISENPLYNAFYSKSFTNSQILLHFLILDILSGGEKLNISEIAEQIYYDIDENTIRNKLKNYIDEGIVLVEKQGKTNYYSLSTDRTDEYFKEYAGLEDMIKFFSGTSEFGVIGDSILKSMDISNDIFLFKHNFIVHTLEDEILFYIITAINQKKNINVKKISKNGNESSYSLVPLKIHVSTQTGRRYLIAYRKKLERIVSERLDYIKEVKIASIEENYDTYMQGYTQNADRCFSVSFGNRKDNKNNEHISFTIVADEKTERYVIDRLYREKRNGTVERIRENVYKYSAEVFDSNETLPWIKTFIGRIIDIDGNNPAIIAKLKRDLQLMYEMYKD